MQKPYPEIVREYPTVTGCARCGNALGDLFFVVVERKPQRREKTRFLCWDCYEPGDPLKPYQHVVRTAVGPDGSLTITRV